MKLSVRWLIALGLIAMITVDRVHGCISGGPGTKGEDGEETEEGEEGENGEDGENGENGDNNGDNGDNGNGSQKESVNNPDAREPTALDKIGRDVNDAAPVDSSAYDGNNGELIDDPDLLSCNFDDDEGCCWANDDTGSDELDWLRMTADPEPNAWEEYTQSAVPPDTPFLLTAARDAPDDRALFVSCPVKCSNSDLLVGLSHWVTGDAKVEVCTRKVDSTDLENCQEADASEDSSLLTLTSEKLESFQVVIVGSGFTDTELGDLAMVDSVFADFEKCPDPDAENCATVPCSFDDGETCGAVPLADPEDAAAADDPLKTIPGAENYSGKVAQFEEGKGGTAYGSNYVIGIHPEDPLFADGGFLVTELDSEKQYAGLLYNIAPYSEPNRGLKFKYYEATDGLIARVCFDEISETGCTFQTPDLTTFAENGARQWQETVVPIPTGAQQLVIVGANEGDNDEAVEGGKRIQEGAVFAIDDVSIVEIDDDGNEVEGSDPCAGAAAERLSLARTKRSTAERRMRLLARMESAKRRR